MSPPLIGNSNNSMLSTLRWNWCALTGLLNRHRYRAIASVEKVSSAEFCERAIAGDEQCFARSKPCVSK